LGEGESSGQKEVVAPKALAVQIGTFFASRSLAPYSGDTDYA